GAASRSPAGQPIPPWMPTASSSTCATWATAGSGRSARSPVARRGRAPPARVTIARRAHGIAATLDVAVPPGADAEVRRVRLHNLSARPRRLEVTTYTEVVLAERGMHVAHPAFAKLFVETEWVAAARALLAHRRPRRAEE